MKSMTLRQSLVELQSLAESFTEEAPPPWKVGDPVPEGWKVVYGRLAKVGGSGEKSADSHEKPGSVGHFLDNLAHLMTQYDARQEKAAAKRGHAHSQYALGHYLAAVNVLRKGFARDLDKTDADTLSKLKKEVAITIMLPPAKKLASQIDTFTSTGTPPRKAGLDA